MHRDTGDAGAPQSSLQRVPPTLFRLGQSLPFAIVIYLIAVATLRLQLSPFLDVGEAELLGAVDLRLTYPTGAPLFNWLVRLVLDTTGWDWPFALTIVRVSALGLFYLAIWDTARRLGGPRAALLAVAASALAPYIIWTSATTLSTSVLAMALAAITLNLMVRLFEDPHPRRYVYVGLAAGFGMLASYSFPLFLLPFLAAFYLEPELRYAFTRRALFAAAPFGMLCSPLLLALVLNFSDVLESGRPLYGDSGFLGYLDPPFLGFDGVLSLAFALVAWGAVAAAVWFGSRLYDRTSGPLYGELHPFAPVVGRALLFGVAGFAALVLLFDMSSIETQLLAPLLSAAPVYLAVAWPLRQSANFVAGVGAALFVVVLPGFWMMVEFSNHRYAIPYRELSGHISRQVEGVPAPIVAQHEADAENLLVALEWPGATTLEKAPIEESVVLVWRGVDAPPPADLAPEGFAPARAILTYRAELRNSSGEEIAFRFQRFDRLPEGAKSAPRPTASSGGAPPASAPASAPSSAPIDGFNARNLNPL